MLIFEEHSKGVVKKEILKLIGREIEDYFFASKELIAIGSEFELKLDRAEPESDNKRLEGCELPFSGSKVG